MLLAGKVVVITGASSGIGAAAADLFAAEGAALVLGARRDELLAEHAERLAAGGAKVAALAGDVRDEGYAEALVELAERSFGGLDGAFNNAGIVGELGALAEMTAKNWHEVLATNLTSAFFAAKQQIPALQRRGRGSIVFNASFVGSTIGLPGMAAYAASKAGLVGLTQVLAIEHGHEDIRFNALLPGGTQTPMAGDDPALLEQIAQMHALKRMAAPEEIAQAALFLLSDRASFITGSAVIADGGNSICKS